MGNWFEVKLEGVKELEKQFKSLEPKIARKIVRQSLRKAAKPMLMTMQAKVPVGVDPEEDPHIGKLKGSLKIRAMKRKKNSYGIVIGTALKWFIGYFYGAHVEFGTSKMSARPFMRPAFDEKKGEAESILVQEIREGLSEAVKSG